MANKGLPNFGLWQVLGLYICFCKSYSDKMFRKKEKIFFRKWVNCLYLREKNFYKNSLTDIVEFESVSADIHVFQWNGFKLGNVNQSSEHLYW